MPGYQCMHGPVTMTLNGREAPIRGRARQAAMPRPASLVAGARVGRLPALTSPGPARSASAAGDRGRLLRAAAGRRRHRAAALPLRPDRPGRRAHRLRIRVRPPPPARPRRLDVPLFFAPETNPELAPRG